MAQNTGSVLVGSKAVVTGKVDSYCSNAKRGTIKLDDNKIIAFTLNAGRIIELNEEGDFIWGNKKAAALPTVGDRIIAAMHRGTTYCYFWDFETRLVYVLPEEKPQVPKVHSSFQLPDVNHPDYEVLLLAMGAGGQMAGHTYHRPGSFARRR